MDDKLKEIKARILRDIGEPDKLYIHISGLPAEVERLTDYRMANEQATISKLVADNARLSAELEAAVEDLRENAAFASTCKKWEESHCGFQCRGGSCPGWEWRGVKGEE
jgi:hypothetical protein